MKQPLYDILDDEYCFLLDRITKIFQERELNPTIVGGAAVQTHVANFLSKVYGKNVEELFLDGKFRPQDHIRGTDDIDLALYNEDMVGDPECYNKYILDTIKEIECDRVESPDGNNIYDIFCKRHGLKRPIFLVKGLNKISEIKLNVENSPRDLEHISQENYVPIVKSGKIIEFPYNDHFKPKIRVGAVEDVIAPKLAHNRPKDQFDCMILGRSAHKAKKRISRKRLISVLGETEENEYKVDKYLTSLKEKQKEF